MWGGGVLLEIEPRDSWMQVSYTPSPDVWKFKRKSSLSEGLLRLPLFNSLTSQEVWGLWAICSGRTHSIREMSREICFVYQPKPYIQTLQAFLSRSLSKNYSPKLVIAETKIKQHLHKQAWLSPARCMQLLGPLRGQFDEMASNRTGGKSRKHVCVHLRHLQWGGGEGGGNSADKCSAPNPTPWLRI